MRTWNRAVYWPESFARTEWLNSKELFWTKHATDRVRDKGLVVPDRAREFEVVERDETGKRVLRVSQGLWDLVLVVRANVLVTAWKNHRDDKHVTLKEHLYAKCQ